ncbi:MAG TPA: hypothetical protein VMC43_02505 [Candidatus Paceibacterota bacterium]|nr:hypothetical protein [Candidatus Paceibacterota bacterium]
MDPFDRLFGYLERLKREKQLLLMFALALVALIGAAAGYHTLR